MMLRVQRIKEKLHETGQETTFFIKKTKKSGQPTCGTEKAWHINEPSPDGGRRSSLETGQRNANARRAASRAAETHEALQRCDAPARKAGAREIERKAAEEIPPTPFFERRTD